ALVALALALGAIALNRVLVGSRLGLRCMAIRDDEPAARAAGVAAARIKVTAFVVSAAVASVGGVLYVWNVGYIDPTSAFSGTRELQVVLMVLVGGIGSMWGPLYGAVLIALIGEVLWARFPLEQQIVLGSITVLTAVLMPGGIAAMLQARGKLKRAIVWAPPPAAASAAAPVRAVARPAGEHVLATEHLMKRYGGVTAVDDVDVTIAASEIVGIIGPNGAGKSTLFDVVTGFTPATSGTVRFRGTTITGRRADQIARAGIARTFQTSRLFATLTIWENVLVAAASVNRDRAAACAEARRVLAQVGLLDGWDQLPATLAPGRQRLLEIARALALRPQVLLLDESMAGMTPDEIAQVHAALRAAVAGGCSIVTIEHVLPAIATLADRVYVLDFGKIIASGPPLRVFRDPIVLDAYIGVGTSALDEVAAGA
ncbi:MAG TPA: branched-chain amino acid ABC transporter ATP-binding protein/permease, partial [Candidatus Elarobacter sp.]